MGPIYYTILDSSWDRQYSIDA